MKKILLIVLIIALSITTISFAARTVSQEQIDRLIAASTTSSSKTVIDTIAYTVAEPEAGKALPTSLKYKVNQSSLEPTVVIGSDEFTNIKAVWEPADETAQAGSKYTLTVTHTFDTGLYDLSNMKTTINGNEVAHPGLGGSFMVSYTFEIPTSTQSRPTTGIRPTRPTTSTTSYDVEKIKNKGEINTEESGESTIVAVIAQLKLKTIDVEVAVPEVGKALPETYTVKSNLVVKASEYKVGEEVEDNYAEWDTADKEVKAGTKYTFFLDMALKNSMAVIADDLKITLNGKEVKPTIKDGVYTIYGTFEMAKAEEKKDETKSGDTKPAEKEMYNHFGFEIAAPKIGEKPATTAKETEEGYKVKKVEWLTKDEKFVEGETYKVQIYFDLINKNVRSDYFATVNGNDADLPDGDANYAKNTMYAEFTFPTLRDTSKKATWSNASTWAIDELAKAAEKGLIPDSLNKEDLTKNITRKEFAHIAVRLYEAITGKGIFVTNAPFSDTDDVEVAKAYTVGITEGTDKEKGLFSPDKEITREQMATMMTRALDKAYIDTFVDLDKVSKFVDDGDLHDWSRNAVYFMNSKDIIKGVSTTENKFGAKGTASREQALLIAIRSVEKFAK